MMMLATYSAIARALTSDEPLEVRLNECFQILAADAPQLDLRLTVWPHGTNAAPRSFTPLQRGGAGWDNARVAQIARRRQPLVLDQPAAPPAPFNSVAVQSRIPDPNGQSYLGLPVQWEGRLWGVLEVRRAGTFNAGERTLVGGLLPLLAVAIGEEQWGRADLDPARERQLDLRAVTRELETPSDLPSLLPILLRRAIEATQAESGAINLVDRERGEYTLHVAAGYSGAAAERRTWPWNVGVVGRVARSGKAALLTDIAHDTEWQMSRPDVRAELIVPVRMGGATLAVIVLHTGSERGFGTDDLYWVQALADAAARPIERAVRYGELLEASTQLGQTLESLPLGLALTDLDGRVLRTNPAWFRVWHVPPPSDNAPQYLPWDLLPMLLRRCSHPLELTDFFAESQAKSGETFETTIHLNEPMQDIKLRSTPVLDADGAGTGRLVIIEDMTREREIEKMKNEFVSVVSHELRTPLTSILGYTELLLARDFKPIERQEFMQTVYDQANQLSKMVDDLLNLSRLDAGQIKLSRWIVSLHQIIRDITKQLNETLSDRHRLLIDIPESIPPIYVDKDKVRQILTNLLSNAIKYSPNGGQIALIVRELRQPPPGAPPLPAERAILIAVLDQGMGIAPDDLSKLFTRFFRVDNSTTRKIGGTGLGLSITKALVELHGGRIWATSELGKGTTFWLTLPVATELARRG